MGGVHPALSSRVAAGSFSGSVDWELGKEKASFTRVPRSPVSVLEALWLNVPAPIPHGIVPSWGPAPMD